MNQNGLAQLLAAQQNNMYMQQQYAGMRNMQQGIPHSCTSTSVSGYWAPQVAASPIIPKSKPKEGSLFTEIATDVKSFIIEHRGTLYFIAFALIIDHLLFKDTFRHRLQAMCDKIIEKVEAKIAA